MVSSGCSLDIVQVRTKVKLFFKTFTKKILSVTEERKASFLRGLHDTIFIMTTYSPGNSSVRIDPSWQRGTGHMLSVEPGPGAPNLLCFPPAAQVSSFLPHTLEKAICQVLSAFRTDSEILTKWLAS